jgi:hypothetical protein
LLHPVHVHVNQHTYRDIHLCIQYVYVCVSVWCACEHEWVGVGTGEGALEGLGTRCM